MAKPKKRVARSPLPRRKRAADLMEFEPDDGVVPPPEDLRQAPLVHPLRRVQVVLELETDASLRELSKPSRYQIDTDGGLEGRTCTVVRAKARAATDR